jgi:hypothetical protein
MTKKNKIKMYHMLKIFPQKTDWYNYFVSYIFDVDHNKYTEACEYASKKQKENK